jgi:hypothetical protein
VDRAKITRTLAGLVATLAVLATAPAASADHQSFLTPVVDGSTIKHFWDDNLDLVPDSGPINFYAKGPGWTTLARQRFDAAGNEWDSKTQFNIDTFMWTTGTSNNRLVFRHNIGSECDPIPIGLKIVAGNAVTTQNVLWPDETLRHKRIKTSCISFNSNDYVFYFGGGYASGYYHWQGILTHEMGHAVLLEHPNASQGDPVCNYTAGDVDALPSLCANPTTLSVAQQQLVSYWRRTLEPIDIHNADWVY